MTASNESPKESRYREALEKIAKRECVERDCIAIDCNCAQRIAEKALSAAPDEPERDYTPEEALAQAIKLWGVDAGAEFRQAHDGSQYFKVFSSCYDLKIVGYSPTSFRDAFAAADKAKEEK